MKQLITLSSCAPGRRSKWCNPRSVAGSTQRSTQRGQLLLVMAVIIVIAFGAAYYALSSPTSAGIERDKITTAALAQVKEALIGWSAARTPTGSTLNARPGELPCPDIDNTGTDPGGCSAGAIGRVPWKSLGIPEPKDSTGETLWYAIAGPFRYYHPTNNPNPITSDTLGNLTVYLGSSATTLTSQAIAVIFAPGMAFGAQDRGCTVGTNCTAAGQCTTSPASLTPKCDLTNYLEATGGGNNAQTGGPFIQAQPSDTFNDRVLAITNADLMPLVEQRVAREMISYLNGYRAATGVYPWGDLGDGNSNSALGSYAYNRNRFSCNDVSTLNTPLPNWGSGGTPTLPNWLTNGCQAGAPVSGWSAVVYYAVAKNRLEGGGAGCAFSYTPCAATSLWVTNSTNGVAIQCTTASPPVCTPAVITTGSADLVLMTPGGDTGSPARSWSQSNWTTITGYFVDSDSTVSSENRDNNDDNFRVPTTTANNRARMYVVR